MEDREANTDRGAKLSFRAARWGVRRLAALIVAIAVAAAVMYGEAWALLRAPASSVACGLAQTADLRRALDTLLTELAEAEGAGAL